MKSALILPAIAAAVLPSAGLAQEQVERFSRQLEQIERATRLRADTTVPAGQRALVDYGALASAMFFSIDDEDQQTSLLAQYELSAWGRVNLDGAHELFVRGRTTYRDWEGGDDDDWVEPTLDRGYYRFDLARHLGAYDGKSIDGNLVVQGGRQLVVWGEGLTLSDDIDGVLGTVSAGPVAVDFLAGQTRSSIDDFETSRPGSDGDTHRNYFGLQAGVQAGAHRPYAFVLVQRDQNDDDTLSLAGTTTRYAYDSHYLGVGSTGSLTDRLIYAVEGVYQGGEGLSNSFTTDPFTPVEQTEEDIEAWAMVARLEYLLGDERRSRLTGEMILASGDEDRLSSVDTFGGNAPGTTDNAFNGLGFLNTGLAFAPAVSNLWVGRVGASTFPFIDYSPLRRLQAGTDVLIFGKMRSAGGIDEATTDDTYLGTEVDFFATWQLASDVTLFFRYGIFFPGDAIANDHDPRNFVLLGVTYAF